MIVLKPSVSQTILKVLMSDLLKVMCNSSLKTLSHEKYFNTDSLVTSPAETLKLIFEMERNEDSIEPQIVDLE